MISNDMPMLLMVRGFFFLSEAIEQLAARANETAREITSAFLVQSFGKKNAKNRWKEGHNLQLHPRAGSQKLRPASLIGNG